MMYGRAEHSETLRRIMRVANHARDERGQLQSLRDDLREDDFEATEQAREYLREASIRFRQAEKLLDLAVENLPTPVAEPVIDWRALYRGGGNDAA